MGRSGVGFGVCCERVRSDTRDGLCLASRGLCLLQRRGGRQLAAQHGGGNAVLPLYFSRAVAAAAPIFAVAAGLTWYKRACMCSVPGAVIVRP
ncbi:hypothetical protein E2C01_010965 [Portunus trituberculatus]|uniref:Uncharacterized protein n=1 Tax=Portunus trituberculatus TaxID=210409 RepID=A0A5B7D9V8_PORTR|nr:hypothetical protein [Portunus trituberculatus]